MANVKLTQKPVVAIDATTQFAATKIVNGVREVVQIAQADLKGLDGKSSIASITGTSPANIPAAGQQVQYAVDASAGFEIDDLVKVGTASTLKVVGKPTATSILLENVDATPGPVATGAKIRLSAVGVAFYFVTAAPSNTVGNDSDIAFRNSGEIYKKVSGSWVGQVNYVSETELTAAIASFLTQTTADARYQLISTLSEAIDDRVAALLVAGNNITLTYNDVGNALTIASTSSGGGGASGVQYVYNDQDPPTSAGQIRTLQASLSVATSVALSSSDANGDSTTDILNRIKTGAIFSIAKDASNYARFEATADLASGSVSVVVRAEQGTISTGDTVFLAISSDAPSAGGIGAGSQLLASGTISATSTANTITIVAAAAASGGVIPYTYSWYKGSAPAFAINSGSLISGATSAGYTDSGLSASTGFYYRRVVTDGLGNKVATDELFATTTAAVGAVSDTFNRTGVLVGSNVETPATGVTYGNYLTGGSSGSVAAGNAQGVPSLGVAARLVGLTLGGTYSITGTINPKRYLGIIARASASASQLEGIWASFIPSSSIIRIESTDTSFASTTLASATVTFSNTPFTFTMNVTPTSVQLLVPSLSVNITATTALYAANTTAGLYFDAAPATPDLVDSWSIV